MYQAVTRCARAKAGLGHKCRLESVRGSSGKICRLQLAWRAGYSHVTCRLQVKYPGKVFGAPTVQAARKQLIGKQLN